MSEQGYLAVVSKEASVCGTALFTLRAKQNVCKDLSTVESMAAGLHSIAKLALDDGEATPEALEHLAALSSRITHDLATLRLAIAELDTNPRDIQ